MIRTKGPIVIYYLLANKHQTYVHTEYADESGEFDKNIHLFLSYVVIVYMYIYKMMIQLYIHMHEYRVCNVGMQQELATGPFDHRARPLVSSRKLIIYLIQLAIEYMYDRLDSDSDTLGT